MPCSFDFDWKNRILRIRLYGRITDEGLKEAYTEGYKLAFRTQPNTGLFDLSETTSLEISPQAIRELAKTAPIIASPNLVRVIIAPSPGAYGIARSFETQSEENRPSLYVVRTEQEALAILNVKNSRFEPLGPV